MSKRSTSFMPAFFVRFHSSSEAASAATSAKPPLSRFPCQTTTQMHSLGSSDGLTRERSDPLVIGVLVLSWKCWLMYISSQTDSCVPDSRTVQIDMMQDASTQDYISVEALVKVARSEYSTSKLATYLVEQVAYDLAECDATSKYTDSQDWPTLLTANGCFTSALMLEIVKQSNQEGANPQDKEGCQWHEHIDNDDHASRCGEHDGGSALNYKRRPEVEMSCTRFEGEVELRS